VATVEEIRAALKATLEDALPTVTVYASGEAVNALPAVLAVPETADFAVSMGRGADTWVFQLVVMVPTGDLAHGQLNAYCSGSGDTSIREIVFTHRDLGLSTVDAHVSAVTAYNVALSSAEIDHVAATLRLIVHTKGTE
jgi:hypothetical protein